MARTTLTAPRTTLTAPHSTLISARSVLVTPRSVSGPTAYTLTASVGAVALSGQVASLVYSGSGSGPSSLVATAVAPLEVRLTWAHASPPADTRYEIERSDGSGGWYRCGTAFPGRLQYSDWGRAKSTSYTYRVRATNSGGSSAYSSSASATTMATDGVPEFVGPFPSWKNVITDFGAVGNGVADDTAAIQLGLDYLKTHVNSCVLYFPAGTYKITGMLTAIPTFNVPLSEWVGTEYQGVSIIGADPATTTIRWAGSSNSTMLNWGAWYAKVSRLTFDGVSQANNITAIHHGPRFSTYDEISDCRFLDCGIGIQLGDGGDNNYKGQAEKGVQRCYFLRCGEGVRSHDFNTLDIWTWYCHFEECGYGVRNRQGNYHVYRSLFERSTIADCSSRNLMLFSMVGNVSKDSVMFFDWDTQGSTSPTSICNNRIIDATGTFAIALRTAGPFLLADNIIKHKSGVTNVVKLSDNADHLLLGNCYDMANAVVTDTEHVNDPSLCHPRFQYVDEEIISTAAIDPTLPTLPQTPASFGRTVYEVAVGASATTIQTAITNAVATGNRAIVHLPAGSYNIASTLNIPANANIQIVGDGASEVTTRLNWTGTAGVPMITIQQPNYSILRDFFLHTDVGDGIVAHVQDVTGGDLNANMVLTQGENVHAATDWWVDGVENADVTSLCHQGGDADAWIKVSGGTQQTAGSTSVPGQVAVFCGATSSCAKQYDIQNGGQLIVRTIYHERSGTDPQPVQLDGRGRLHIDCNRFSIDTDPSLHMILTNGFQGDLLISTGVLLPVSSSDTPKVQLTGNGSNLREMIALQAIHTIPGTETSADIWLNSTSPAAQAGFKGNWGESGSGLVLWQLADVGTVTDAFVRAMYAPLRSFRIPLPRLATSGAGSIMLQRIMISTATGCIAVRITT